MKIVFFGTPEYVIPILDALRKEFDSPKDKAVIAVITQAPQPTGRKQLLTYSPVDNFAYKRKISIFHSSRELIEKGVEADLGVLAAYGEIIPPEVIKLFPKGILNIHPSLLPKYRGASPVQAAIAAGEAETGVSIIKLDDKLDHGDIYAQFKEEILKDDTTESLRKRLFERSADILVALMPAYLAGKIHPRKQDDSEATFTIRADKEHGFIPFEYLKAALEGKSSPQVVERFIRAMFPWPGAWSKIKIMNKELRIKILKAHLEGEKLVPNEVQLEGKTPVSWKQFLDAYASAIPL
ncbi:methionyl-tRNA formyltransferase [Patescibacteria group bacterium]|nr:methionyl-tRNA formyltransferase [Patescibacteria group bacterium]